MSDQRTDLRHRLRQENRRARRALAPDQQVQAARRLSRIALNNPLLRRARHIALYLPNDGELDPRPLMQQLWQRGYHVYLPVLSKKRPGFLVFRPYTPHSRLTLNRFGIPEPHGGTAVSGHTLDAVLLPLVAFDYQGNRLGMGGGFYDRTFARRWRRPPLLGVAHAFQVEPHLPFAPWDVPLSGVLTDRRSTLFRRSAFIRGAQTLCLP